MPGIFQSWKKMFLDIIGISILLNKNFKIESKKCTVYTNQKLIKYQKTRLKILKLSSLLNTYRKK